MPYAICLAKRTYPRVIKDGEEDQRAPFTRCQYLDFDDLSEAQLIADKLGHFIKNTIVTVGVRVWNGKGNTFVPLDTIVQVYDDMTRTARVAE